MKTVRRVGTLILAIIVTMSGVLFFSSSAFAVSCSKDGCSNKDPRATGCSVGAFTQVSVAAFAKTDLGLPNYIGELELRGSNTCGSTQWARFTPVYGDASYEIRAEQPETGYATDWQGADAFVTAWSNQIYSPAKCVRGHIITHTMLSHMDYFTPCL